MAGYRCPNLVAVTSLPQEADVAAFAVPQVDVYEIAVVTMARQSMIR